MNVVMMPHVGAKPGQINILCNESGVAVAALTPQLLIKMANFGGEPILGFCTLWTWRDSSSCTGWMSGATFLDEEWVYSVEMELVVFTHI